VAEAETGAEAEAEAEAAAVILMPTQHSRSKPVPNSLCADAAVADPHPPPLHADAAVTRTALVTVVPQHSGSRLVPAPAVPRHNAP